MSDIQKHYKCNNCDETFNKGELNNGKLPLHDFNKKDSYYSNQYRNPKRCAFTGRSAVLIR